MAQSPGMGRESGQRWRASVAANPMTSSEHGEEEGAGAGAGVGAGGGAGVGAGRGGAGAAGPAEEAMAQDHSTRGEESSGARQGRPGGQELGSGGDVHEGRRKLDAAGMIRRGARPQRPACGSPERNPRAVELKGAVIGPAVKGGR